MEPTRLLYLETADLVTESTVLDVIYDGEQTKIVLDATLFYPQGGGQPSDRGEILSQGGVFAVESVRFVDGLVYHQGAFTAGTFKLGDKVTGSINKELRLMHSRLHSAGHLIDFAMRKLGFKWRPTKGYHFADGPYVEYAGTLDSIDIEKLQKDLGAICNDTIKKDAQTRSFLVTLDELKKLCESVPEYLPQNKPIRVVVFEDFYVPCGGTHVSRLSEIGALFVKKIKAKGELVRISYTISE